MEAEVIMVRTILGMLAVLGLAAARADNWPAWRGPTGQGQCLEQEVPIKWSPTENVRWKVALPDAGNSSPIVWGDRVFITQASDKKLWPPQVSPKFPKGTSAGGMAIVEKRSVLCFHRDDGRLLWQADTFYKEPEPTHPTNPFCSATPVTDGERVIASHGSAGLVCHDFASGKLLWKYEVGPIHQVWGNASSPVLYGDLCIQWCGPGERQFLLAVDKRTGQRVWQVDEPNGHSGIEGGTFVGSWSTPLLARVGDQDQLIFSVPGQLRGYEPRTGKLLWYSGRAATSGYSYPSPLYADGVAIDNGTLVQLGGSGDITKDQLKHKVGSMYISSGVIAGDYLYTYSSVGIPACYEWKTGRELWKEQIQDRPGGTQTWTSLVHAAGRVYLTDQRGTTLVFAAGPRYQHLASNHLKETTNASLAVSNSHLFIRTHKHLWCISEKKE